MLSVISARHSFIGRPVPGLRPTGNGLVVVVDNEGEPHIVPATDVYSGVHAYHYARQWSMMTGRPMSDVYIPEALR